MSNDSRISRLELTLDRYERGEIGVQDVERALGLYLPALEQIGTAEGHEAGRLIARLSNAHLIDDPPIELDGQLLTFEGDEPVADVLRDFRDFLALLPR